MKKIKILLFIALILGTSLIFVESLMPEDISKNQSDAVGGIIGDIIDTPKDQKEFNFLTRKVIGHFGAFLLLGICCLGYFSFINKKIEIAYIITLTYGLCVGIFSELLQKIPKGRVCSKGDVAIDFFGLIIGSSSVFIVLFTIEIFRRIKGKKKYA